MNSILPTDSHNSTSSMIDSAAHAADEAIRGSQRMAADASALAQRSVEALRGQALHARDATRGYIQQDPLKAVLIAAAAGAGLVLLGTLLTSRRQ